MVSRAWTLPLLTVDLGQICIVTAVLCCAVVINRDGKLEEAVEQINAIITAEKHRTSRIRWQDADVAQQQEDQAERQPSLHY